MSGEPPAPAGRELRDDRAVADMYRMLDSAQRIVARGQAVFIDPVDDTQYLAAKALIMDMQSAAGRLSEAFKATHPGVPWHQLKRTRDKLGHHYLGIDKVVIWRVLAVEFPRIREELPLPRG